MFLTVIATLPDGADCVDHVFGIQVEAQCDSGVTEIYVADLFSGLKQLAAGFFMYSAVNAGADDGVGVGGVYYCVCLHVGDVVSYYFEGHGGVSFCEWEGVLGYINLLLGTKPMFYSE